MRVRVTVGVGVRVRVGVRVGARVRVGVRFRVRVGARLVTLHLVSYYSPFEFQDY